MSLFCSNYGIFQLFNKLVYVYGDLRKRIP